ncbi:MAG: arsenite methyltransferase [Anaerolineaceae bacterium]
MATNNSNEIRNVIREHYGELAQKVEKEKQSAAGGGCGCGCGCGPDSSCSPKDLEFSLESNDYSAEAVADLPESVKDISLGCGNPTAIAELKPGEVVLDLGSGGGIDCFLAANQVGETGRVIGLDMTTKMIDLARRNAKKRGVHNVEFQYGYIEDIPLPDESVDSIISNCVINLSVDKDAVFREAYRVLRKGGRLNVSDIVQHRDLPPFIKTEADAWAGCMAGALQEDDYINRMRTAGFTDIEVLKRTYYPLGDMDELKAHAAEIAELGLSEQDLNTMLASITVRARK